MLSMMAVLIAAQSAFARPELLVDTTWLAAHLNDPNVRIVDLRPKGYGESHIPNAVWLDNNAIRMANRPPTFLPTPAAFEQMMGKLGISNTTRVIVYDERGGIYAARLWWILSYYGHTNVALMNGGWLKWAAEQRPTTTESPAPPAGRFTARPQPKWLATASDVVAAIDKPGIAIVDARTSAEIEGKDLRNIKRGGFIPSSTPVYWEDLLDMPQRTFKSADELKQIYEARGIVPTKEVIAYCQVGMRASVDLFALHLIGYDKLRNYLGSWEEWGNRDDLPIATKKP